MTDAATTPRSMVGLGALAALSASAGLIHAALAPSHMGEWALEGVGFAVAAWIQLGLAATLLRRPSLLALEATVVANLAILAAWFVSRTIGFPFGPNSGHPESYSFVDLACAGLELALVAGALAAIAAPRVHRPALDRLVPLAAVLVTTSALLSPSARNHAHDAHAGHVHATSADDGGFSLLHNGHHAHLVSYTLDPASQGALDAQLAVTRDVASRYPTVADAEAAGYRRAGPYSPGLGAHYVLPSAAALNPDGVLDAEDLAHPLSIQYDGTSPSSPVAGFMYYSIGAVEPQGFVGRNDVWHVHTDLCLKYGPDGVEAPFGADKQASKQQCDQVGGTLMKQTQWMLHVWSVPGYRSADGVFAEMNRRLDCPDGTFYELPPDQWASHLTNICRSEA